MSSDEQYTAMGPAIVGFQTDPESKSIDRGAEIIGNSLGVLGQCDRGNGVHGKSGSPSNSGVWGENTGGGYGVAGSSNNGVGVLGEGKNGVHGRSRSSNDSGVWGENSGGGYGVAGSSDGVGVFGGVPNSSGLGSGRPDRVGVWGTAVAPETFEDSGDGVLGEGKNGVHGRSRSPTDSGVWGENIGGGYGVAGSSNNGVGVLGEGKNGVHGRSRSSTDSGVWGENSGSGYGVAGSSNGVGVFGGVPKSLGLGGRPELAGVWGTTIDPGEPGPIVRDFGDGVLGEGQNGVHGRSRSPTDSGVWGENTGRGVGVAGSSVNGYGGQFTGAFAPLYLTPSATQGHPASGTHKRGEFYVDSAGSLFYCKADGTPGTWVNLA